MKSCTFLLVPDILVQTRPSGQNGDGGNGIDTIDDVPQDALSADSLSQFHTHMRPYLWMEYPSATSAEINAIIHRKWKVIQATRKGSTHHSFYLVSNNKLFSFVHTQVNKDGGQS